MLIEESPHWDRITDTIIIGKRLFNFKKTKSTKVGIHLSKELIFDLFETSISKSVYLKYLASEHSEEYKIIPINEVYPTKNEESFLFRLTTRKGNVLIFWENINDKRATHVFFSTPFDHDDVLAIIQSYICTTNSDKRAILHGGYTNSGEIRRELNYVGSIQHFSLNDFKDTVQHLIRLY